MDWNQALGAIIGGAVAIAVHWKNLSQDRVVRQMEYRLQDLEHDHRDCLKNLEALRTEIALLRNTP